MKSLRASLVLAISAGLIGFLYLMDITAMDGWSAHSPDHLVLRDFQKDFQHCVKVNGFGLHADPKGYCRVAMTFPSGTVPKWRDPKTGKIEALSYDFNLCETLSLWEQVRNTSTVLTREYIDALPNGWEEYAWKRINKGIQLYGLSP